VKAELVVMAISNEKALASARKSFAEFFGEEPFEIVEGTARGECSIGSNGVHFWICGFSAQPSTRGGFEA
jgi:hypothetical protein